MGPYVVEVLDARLQVVQHVRSLLVILRVWIEVTVVAEDNRDDAFLGDKVYGQSCTCEKGALTSRRFSELSDQSGPPRKR